MNRRTFLGAAALGGPTLFGALSARARADTVTLGVIGTGARGSGLLRVIDELPGLRAIACCDVLPFRLDQGLAIADDGARGYSDHRALLDDPRVDAVIVATPLSTHHAIVRDVLAAGKHLYCEKTMTYQIDEALDLVTRAAATDAVIQVGYQYRYHPLYVEVAERIRAGELGQVTHVAMQWNRNGDWRRPVPDPQLERLINWRMYREFSGGLLAELGSHQLDFVNFVFESRPDAVVGFGGIDYWKDGRETYDNVNVVFDYPQGMTVSFVSLTANAHDGYRIELRGSRGTVELTPDTGTWYAEGLNHKERGLVDGVSGATFPSAGAPGSPIEVGVREGWNGTHYALDGFHRAIVHGESPSSDVTRGARSAITTRLAIDAVRDGSQQRWLPEYDQALSS